MNQYLIAALAAAIPISADVAVKAGVRRYLDRKNTEKSKKIK